jgi:hypothetical protein
MIATMMRCTNLNLLPEETWLSFQVGVACEAFGVVLLMF